MPTLGARFRRGLARDLGLIILGLFLGGLVLLTGRLALDGAVQEVRREAYRQDIAAWHGRIDGCERGKLDRSASAKAFRAQSDYLNLVLDAKSVQADVKRAARVNQTAQDWSASSMESRTGRRLTCPEAYPKPPPPAGVDPLP